MDALGVSTATFTAAEELSLDIALHVGSLGAVLVYFRRDVWLLLLGLADGLTGRMGPRFRLVLVIIAASLPIVAVAYLAKDLITNFGRNVPIIAVTTIVFGILLWISDRRSATKAEIETLSFRDAIVVGIAQCIAIIPGASRSGICMTAGRFMGLDRVLSARLAMLLSIPTILGAGVLAGYDLYQSGSVALTNEALIGAALAFLSALAAIAVLMKWLEHQSYLPFVIYRIVLGVVLFGLIGLGLT